MYKYEIIIYWSSKDNSYIAEVTELAGCMTDSETMEQTLENVKIVIDEWIETAKIIGRDIPKPKGRLKYT